MSDFGTTTLGPEFTWTVIEPNTGVARKHKFRAAAGISFDDALHYGVELNAAIVRGTAAAREMKAKLVEALKNGDSQAVDLIIQERYESENRTWLDTVNAMLLLIAPGDRDIIRPMLVDGDKYQVKALREWLEENVMGEDMKLAQQVARVDPTSPPPPPPSAVNPASGPVSVSEAPSSTD